MVLEVDENPSYVSLASVSPRYEYDQSGVTMAEVLALSPLYALPLESALLAVAPAVTPPKADSHPRQLVVLQA